jgi:hypothetical protein
MPAVSPYCNPAANAPSSILTEMSFGASGGESGSRAVKLKEVKGNVDALGLPASREMTPGVFSRGKSPRTVHNNRQLDLIKRRTGRTRTRLPFLRVDRQELIVIADWKPFQGSAIVPIGYCLSTKDVSRYSDEGYETK